MAIVVPADWQHLTKGQLVGYVPAGIEPVNALAQRSHWYYKHHSPSVFSGVIWNAAATTQEAFFPVSPSADGLEYTIALNISYAANDTYTLRAYYTADSATNGASWTLIDTDSASLTGSPTFATLTAAGTVPATAKFLRVVTSTGASSNHQVTGITVYPSGNHTPPAAAASGFAGFDNGFLTTGAPIHTEYLNRAANNFKAVYQDRKWCVWSWIQTASAGVRIAASVAGGQRPIGMAQVTMPDDLLSRTATVKIRANDSAGSDGFVEVYQVNGATTGSTLTADNTDRSTTITLTGDKPVIAARTVGNGTVDVYYISVEVAPTLEQQGTSKDIITAAAPPARTEYLTTIDGLQSRLYWQAYPVPGVVFDPSTYTAGHIMHGVRVGPGVKRFRPCATRYVVGEDASTVVGMAAFFNTDSGTSAHEKIVIQSEKTGNSQKHPINGSTDEEKQNSGFLEWGSLTDMTSVDASTYPSGVDRLAEIAENDEPQLEIFSQFVDCFGFGGAFVRVSDVTTL